jgi:hypothetical protein
MTDEQKLARIHQHLVFKTELLELMQNRIKDVETNVLFSEFPQISTLFEEHKRRNSIMLDQLEIEKRWYQQAVDGKISLDKLREIHEQTAELYSHLFNGLA